MVGTPVTGNEDQLSNCRRVSAFLGKMLLSTETWKNNKKTINMSHLHKHAFLYTTHTQRREDLLRNTFQQVLQDTNKLRSGRTLAVCSHLASGLRGVAPGDFGATFRMGSCPPSTAGPRSPPSPLPPLPRSLHPCHPSRHPHCLSPGADPTLFPLLFLCSTR